MKYTGSIHTTFYALLAAAALTAAGCSDDDNEKGGGETGVEANFSAEITPYTRAAGDTWTNGDAVGIYMLGGDAGTADLLTSLAGALNYFTAGLLAVGFMYFITMLLLICSSNALF